MACVWFVSFHVYVARRKAEDDEEEEDTPAVAPAAKRPRRGRSAATEPSASATTATDGQSPTLSASPAATATPKRAGYWQWEADGSVWTDFCDDHQDELSEGLTSGESIVVLTIPNTKPAVKMRVNFDRMSQANERTGYARSVRCLDPACHSDGSQRKCYFLVVVCRPNVQVESSNSDAWSVQSICVSCVCWQSYS